MFRNPCSFNARHDSRVRDGYRNRAGASNLISVLFNFSIRARIAKEESTQFI